MVSWIGLESVGKYSVIVAEKTCQISEPGSVSPPWETVSIAARCLALAFSSTIVWNLPLPRWIAPGQAAIMPHRNPSRGTSPKWPFSICTKQNARQWPCVGRPLNWQGQPQLQLQLENSSPCIAQSTYLLI